MIAAVLAQRLVIQNRQRFLLQLRVVGLAANIAMNLLLLPTLGVQGAAIASVCAEIFVVIILLRNFQAGGWISEGLGPSWLRLGALGVLVALVMATLRETHPILGIIGGWTIYIAGLYVWHILRSDDWELLCRLAEAMPGGALLVRYRRWHMKLRYSPDDE